MDPRTFSRAAVRAVAVTAVAAGVVAGAGVATASSGTTGSSGSSTAAATVDMQALLKAAQIDPGAAQGATTPGAADDVEVVERALQDEGLLDAKWVDGSFGTSTIAAYQTYQESLGYTGVAANGLPGPASLRALADGRFTVTHVVTPGAHVTEQGGTINTRTRDMLDEAERLLGRDLVLQQGSYNPGGDPTSAGTHDGGGVVDLSVDGLSDADRTETVRVLRTVGFAAWLRDPSQGDWPYHVHAVAISDPDLSSQARDQVGDYFRGRDGLADDGPDDGPAVTPIRTWEEYQASN